MVEEEKTNEQDKINSQFSGYDAMGGNNGTKKLKVSYYYDDEFSV